MGHRIQIKKYTEQDRMEDDVLGLDIPHLNMTIYVEETGITIDHPEFTDVQFRNNSRMRLENGKALTVGYACAHDVFQNGESNVQFFYYHHGRNTRITDAMRSTDSTTECALKTYTNLVIFPVDENAIIQKRYVEND